MDGFNLPPGVSTRNLPGNRPEDEQMEIAYEKIQTLLREVALQGTYAGVVELLNWWWDDLPVGLRDSITGIKSDLSQHYCDYCGRDTRTPPRHDAECFLSAEAQAEYVSHSDRRRRK